MYTIVWLNDAIAFVLLPVAAVNLLKFNVIFVFYLWFSSNLGIHIAGVMMLRFCLCNVFDVLNIFMYSGPVSLLTMQALLWYRVSSLTKYGLYLSFALFFFFFTNYFFFFTFSVWILLFSYETLAHFMLQCLRFHLVRYMFPFYIHFAYPDIHSLDAHTIRHRHYQFLFLFFFPQNKRYNSMLFFFSVCIQ